MNSTFFSISVMQPEYTYATHHRYSHPPGYLKTGYFIAAPTKGYRYKRSAAVNPSYYYSESYHKAYFGPWYRPAPVVKPPLYTPYESKSSYG